MPNSARPSPRCASLPASASTPRPGPPVVPFREAAAAAPPVAAHLAPCPAPGPAARAAPAPSAAFRCTIKLLPQLLQQVQPIHPRQFHVRDQRVRLVTRKFRQRLFRRGHAHNVAPPALQKLFVALSRIVLIFDDQHAVLPLHHLDGPHRPPCFFPHGSQPLFGPLLTTGSRTNFLDTSTLTSQSTLAKFSGRFLNLPTAGISAP